MKNYKKIIILFIIMGLVGCDKQSAEKEVKDIKQKIVFIYEYNNAAYEYTYKGFYIDNEGNVFRYDFSNAEEDHPYGEDLPNYLVTMNKKEPVGRVDKDDLLKYYNMLLKVDESARTKNKVGGNDMGTKSYYGVLCNEEGIMKLVLLYSTGDSEAYNTDKYAKKISKWFKSHPIKKPSQ